MRDHVVRQGECLSSIAFENGFFWEVLWAHEKNARLRERYDSPHVLKPGDIVHVPDLRPKGERCDTGARHRFQRKGVPETLKLNFSDGGVPRAHVPYILVIDEETHEGETDAGGGLRHGLPPNAREGKLVLLPHEGSAEVYTLYLRHLDPVTEITGVQARLANLGFYSGPVDGDFGPETAAAVRVFQRANGLPESGEADGATRDALVQAHQS